MKKNLLILVMFIFMTFNQMCYADNLITADSECNDRYVSISGRLDGITYSHPVMLFVGEIEKPLFCNQIMTNIDGSFCFEFDIPYGVHYGEYPYVITSLPDVPAFYGSFDYAKPISEDTYIFTESIAVLENSVIPYFVTMQSVENMIGKTIIIEYPQNVLELLDACLFTSAKETDSVNLINMGIDIKSISDGRIEFELTNEFVKRFPLRVTVASVLFKGLTDGMADITTTVINSQEEN